MKWTAVLGLAAGLAACDERNQQGATIEAVALNPTWYAGMTVTLEGEVEEVYGPGLFVLANEDLFSDEIVVSSRSQTRLEEGAEVVVTGTVRAFTVVEMEREYGWDLDPQIEAELEGVGALLEASTVSVIEPE